jgi:O-Antigen ligase
VTLRRAVTVVAAACLLGGPTVVAFFSGGYYASSRLPAAIVAWALVLALAATGPAPLPRGLPGRLALAGLTAIAVWSAISLAWAPLGGPAVENVQRVVLYCGALLVAFAALRTPAAMRAVEPALAAGAALVIGYGLAGRLLPGIVELDRSESAGGRLEQPITYWNGEGALAAIGLILCARLAGDSRRPRWMRGAAAACAVPLATGVYLSYSRGAMAVAVLGLAFLVAAAPTGGQLRAAAIVLVAGVAASACAAAFPGVAALEGGSRTRDGGVVLAILMLLAAVSALMCTRGARRRKLDDTLPWARRLGPVVAVGIAGVVAGLVLGGVAEKPSPEEAARADATRLASVSSNRYEYWRVGLNAFEREPFTGVGSGGFRVEWLRERSFPEAVRDTHSIEVEMAAELGIVGLLAFGLMVVGVAAAARRGLRRDPAMAAGWCAALLAWFLHASIDWDWQLPAVTLPAVALAGALVALSDAPAVSAER